jgi:hypothetical protein
MPVPREPWRLLLVASVALFLAHAVLFRDWLIDDAGISLAYARTLAGGYGLRAQPGVDPVEGFSNPLWTLLLAGVLRTGLSPALAPKLMSLLLVAAAFLVLALSCRRGSPSALAAAFPLLLLPLNTSFVVWTISGLENPLLAALVVLSCALSLEAVRDLRESPSLDRASGAVAGLLALTRPDAVVYAAAYPLVLLAFARREGAHRLVGRLARVASTLLPLPLGYGAFRVLYFRDWVPNTYHAKDKPSLLSLLDTAKLLDLVLSLAGPLTLAAVVLVVVALVVVRPAPMARRRQHVLLLYLGLATAVYMMMPADWMGEYRFATAFFVFACWYAGEVLAGVSAGVPATDLSVARLGAAVEIGAPVLVAATVLLHGARSRDFAQNPVVPFSRVAAFSGRGYNRLADVVGRPGASLLTPDMGGTLFYSTMKVYDLAGLCDRVIARTLRSDRPAFLRYVFDEVRPTFIHVHASWAEWADLSADPRLRRDYVAIAERHDGPPEWRRQAPSDVPWSADYVRRDALAGDAATLGRLRETFLVQGMPALSP